MPPSNKEAALLREVQIARALRWTYPVERDLAAPTHGGSVIQGWDVDLAGHVYEAWSSCAFFGMGQYVAGNRRLAKAKGRRDLYSTKALALQALRSQTERRAAEKLAEIDAQIEALRGKP